MSLIEKIKGFFKPKPTFEQFAVAITSDVRIAIIMELGLMYKHRKGYSFKAIKYGVFDRLSREVSSGSLTWHLEKLKDNKIIEEIPVSDYTVWNLTSIGREAFKLVEKVEKEMESLTKEVED